MINFEQFLGLHMPVATYSVQLRCFSAPFFQNYDTQKINELNYGGKILLPNSCLDNLVRRNIQWPMLFKLSNVDPSRQRATHAGVLEFLAEEGRCYLPSWIMNQLNLQEADLIVVEYESLPKATYAKFKPMSVDFYQITNPRAMLEMELRKFSCLTKGDVIAVRYNEQVFEFQVMGLKPQNAVTIIECDINIEFEAAEGYVEPSAKAPTEQSQTEQVQMPETPAFKAFSGPGNRLDGKKPRNLSTSDVVSTSHQTAGPSTAKGIAPQNGIKAPIIVDENYKPGELRFVRTNYKSKATLEKADENNDDDGVKPFSGKGNKIRK